MVEAIVTSLFEDDDQLSGFFLQEEDPDSDRDPATSEGIFVYCSTACPDDLAVSDRVTVVGVAGEFGGASQINASVGSVTIRSSGKDLPTATPLSLPAPAGTRAEGTSENVEGMIVTFSGRLVVNEYYWLARYGQLVLTDGPYLRPRHHGRHLRHHLLPAHAHVTATGGFLPRPALRVRGRRGGSGGGNTVGRPRERLGRPS